MKWGWAITEKEKLVHWQWIVCWGKVGAVLCSVGCLAPSLVFNQQMQVAACLPVFQHEDNCWVPRVLEGRISTGRAPLILAQMYILWLPRWVCMCLVLGMEMGALYILLKCPTAKPHPSPWQLLFFWDRVSICSSGWPWFYTLLLLLLPNAETRVWSSIYDFQMYTFGAPLSDFSILMSHQRFRSSSLPQDRCVGKNEITGHLWGLASAPLISESILESLVSFELLLVRLVVTKLFR